MCDTVVSLRSVDNQPFTSGFRRFRGYPAYRGLENADRMCHAEAECGLSPLGAATIKGRVG